MGIVDPSDPNFHLRGKVGGFVYSQQPDGTVTVRGVGTYTAEPSQAMKSSRHRMALGNKYVHGVLADPALRAPYETEAQARKMRTNELIMSDFLTQPVIAGIDMTKFTGAVGGWLLVVTGDDFKVTRVGVVVRDATGRRVEEGFAVPVQGSLAKTWMYTATKELAGGQVLTIEVTATDRALHSVVRTITHPL